MNLRFTQGAVFGRPCRDRSASNLDRLRPFAVLDRRLDEVTFQGAPHGIAFLFLVPVPLDLLTFLQRGPLIFKQRFEPLGLKGARAANAPGSTLAKPLGNRTRMTRGS